MSKVSVIIPVYNVERYLGECLDSVLGQTLKDIEVLCVDDGSTDGSAGILARYAEKDPRLKLFSSPHAGAFRAREVGVKVAQGEFSYFMDADDMLDKHALEELCALADRERLDQIVFGSSVFCEDGVSPGLRKWAKGLVRYYSIPPQLCGQVMPGVELMERLLELDHFHVSPPLRLIRTSVLQGNDYPFPDATSRADNYFTPLSLYYSARACAVAGRYYRRRVRDGSITTENGSAPRLFRNMLHVMLALYRFQPFRADFLRPDSALNRFMMKLASGLDRWTRKLASDERRAILARLDEAASPEERVFLFELLLHALHELKRRPKPTFCDTFVFALRRMARRVLWRGDPGWFLR